MNHNSLGLVKNYTCSTAIKPYRLVAIDGATEQVLPAADGDAALVGVTGVVGTEAAGERVDVYKDNVRTVEYGGPIDAGDPVTAGADGVAVKAEPGAGVLVRIIGFAEETALAGARGQIHIAPQFLRG